MFRILEAPVKRELLELPRRVFDETADVLRCLGHPIRLRILDLLERRGELTVTEVFEGVDIEQAVASQHLSLMHGKGVLERRKDGVHVFYSIRDDRALKVLACVRSGDL